MQSVSSPRSALVDFTSVEIPERDYPAQLRERQYDAVVISTEQDKQLATVFKYILTEYVTLEVC